MAWATMPAVAATAILKAQFDEVRAAIVERCNATGESSAGLPVAAANGDQPRATLTAYRAKVDNLIPQFVDPATWNPYAKNTLLTALIGAADWVANPDAVPLRMFIREINELRTVLNALRWVAFNFDTIITGREWSWDAGAGSSDVSWAAAWAAALGAYPPMFPAVIATGYAGFGTTAYSPSPPDGKMFYKDVWKFSCGQASKAIPNVPTSAAVMIVRKNGYGDPGVIDLHQQAVYGGAPINVNVGAGDHNLIAAVNLTAPAPGVTADYSMRCNPVAPNPLLYAPADANGATRGWRLELLNLVVQFNFSYQ